MTVRLTILCSALIACMPAQAATQALADVASTAENFVRASLPQESGAHYHITVTAPDTRLRLAPCGTALQAFRQGTHANTSRLTIGVRCAAPTQWTVYLAAAVEVERTVLVLQRPLARHATLLAQDVQPQLRRLPAGDGQTFLNDVQTLKGKRLRRALPAGTTLRADMLLPEVLIRRGQRVTLLAQAGGLQVRAPGTALAEAAAHERVRVQNLSSQRVVEGVVDDNGLVRVEL
jgi:flagella basal body P-ring formation protein FlgA